MKIRLKGESGTTIVFRYGEMLNPDGTLYTQNLRGAPQIDRYTLKGDPNGEVFEPHFTYHGFRYVEISGLDYSLSPTAMEGCVIYSSASQTGTFQCSNDLLNKLWEMILWTQRGNLFGVPTDCPQRDERLGWQGDIQAFAQTGIHNMDLAGFLTKCCADQRDAQTTDGCFADFCPVIYVTPGQFTGAPAWGDAGVMIPWDVYVNYGDTRLLEQQYQACRRWVDYIHSQNPDMLWRHARGNDYNDWLNSDSFKDLGLPKTGGDIPHEVFASAFFSHSLKLVANMAGVLGYQDQQNHYHDLAVQARSAFIKAFISEDGRILGDTQAGYALALHFDLVPDHLREKALEHLLYSLDLFGGRLSTGIQTTHHLMLELARNGQMERAYQLALRRDLPSWGFMIDQGATTIWERWDGFVPERGFQDPGMNSFNHWAFGSVGEWIYSCVLGITPDPEYPGYEHFTVHPRPGGGLTSARGSYQSIRGKIQIEWFDQSDAFKLNLTVPPNTKATVVLPQGQMSESGDPVTEAQGIQSYRQLVDHQVLKVLSGIYQFEVKK